MKSFLFYKYTAIKFLYKKIYFKIQKQKIVISKDSESIEGNPIIMILTNYILLYDKYVFKYDGFILNMVRFRW